MKVLNVNAKNLRKIAGLNGTTVSALAEMFRCSRALLYQAADHPKQYPNLHARLCEALPVRTLPKLAHA